MKTLYLLKAESKKTLLELLRRTSYSTESTTKVGQGQCSLAIQAHHQDHFEKLKNQISGELTGFDGEFLQQDAFCYSTLLIPENQRAFLFPGQGSQHVKMLEHLLNLPAFKENLNLSLEKMQALGFNLRPFWEGKREGIDQTENAQPLLACFNFASLKLIESLKIQASFSAGHSFGELSALFHGELIKLDELLEISVKRGELMAKANQKASGKMLAVFSKDNKDWRSLHRKMTNLCPEAADWLANINSPTQLVYSGKSEEILHLRQLCLDAEIKNTLLSASAAFHSKLMKSAEEEFYLYLQKKITIKKLSSKTIIPNNPQVQYQHSLAIPRALSAQLTSAVDWISVIKEMEEKGVKLFIEVGAKSILTKLTREMAKNSICLSLDAKKDINSFILPLLALGVDLDLSTLMPEKLSIAESGENKVMKGFLDKQQKLLMEVSHLPAHEQSVARKKITEDIDAVMASFFKIEGKNQEQKRDEERDEVTQIILEEISTLTGFQPSEIRVDARFDSDLYLDSMTRLELLSHLAEKFQADVSDMTALLNANSIRELKAIISKYHLMKEPTELFEEVTWLKNQIINYTGLSEDKIRLSSRFNEDLMLDSLIKMDLISSLNTNFPHLQLTTDDLGRINSLQEIQQLLIQQHPPKASLNSKEKKFSRSIREELARFLGLRLENIKSTSDFEHELNLNIFEKEDFINSLLIRHPYLQQANRELLHAKTLGDILEIEEIFDRRSPNRGSDEEISRFQFDLEEVLVKEEHFKIDVHHAFLNIGPWDKDFPFYQLFGLKGELKKDQSFQFKQIKDFFKSDFFHKHPHFSDYFIVLNFKSLDCDKKSLDRFIQELYFLCQALRELDKNSHRVHLIFDSQQNPLINSIPSALRSLSKEVKLNIKILDIKLNKSQIKNIPWSFFKQSSTKGVEFLTGQGKKYFREKIKEIEPPKLMPKISLPSRPHILLVGGARGITSEVAKFLAGYRQAIVTAMGRTPLSPEKPYPECLNERELREKIKNEVNTLSPQSNPAELNTLFNFRYNEVSNQREIWKTKESIERRGGEFHYIKADATQKNEFEKAIKAILQDIGPIHGIIHAVGLTRDGLLKNKSFEDFHQVISTKLSSAIHVYEHFFNVKKLSFVCFFSSLSSWSGAPGQVDYSYANEFLNQLALKWNQKSSYPVSSLLWSVWSETGLAQESLIQRMQELKLSGISNRAGIRLFKEEILQHGLNHSKVLFTPRSTLNYSIKGLP